MLGKKLLKRGSFDIAVPCIVIHPPWVYVCTVYIVWLQVHTSLRSKREPLPLPPARGTVTASYLELSQLSQNGMTARMGGGMKSHNGNHTSTSNWLKRRNISLYTETRNHGVTKNSSLAQKTHSVYCSNQDYIQDIMSANTSSVSLVAATPRR